MSMSLETYPRSSTCVRGANKRREQEDQVGKEERGRSKEYSAGVYGEERGGSVDEESGSGERCTG